MLSDEELRVIYCKIDEDNNGFISREGTKDCNAIPSYINYKNI